jgi:hypothetical protein
MVPRPIDQAAQIEASRVRLANSRSLCRNSDALIRESRETITRSLARLENAARLPGGLTVPSGD